MTYYLIILLICMLSAYCYERIVSDNTLVFSYKKTMTNANKNKWLSFTCLFVIFGILTLTMGLRDISVGTDTKNYLSIFNQIQQGSYPLSYLDSSLFYLTMTWIIDLGGNYQQWLFFISIFFGLFFVLNIKLSKKPWLTTLMFFVLDYIFMSMNIMRQMLGMLILSYVILSKTENIYKLVFKGYLLVCAMLMHKIMLLLAPFIVIVALLYKKISLYWYFIISTIGLYFVLFGKDIVLSIVRIIYPGYVAPVDNLQITTILILLIYAILCLSIYKYRGDAVKNERVFGISAAVFVFEIAVSGVYYTNNLERILIVFGIYVPFLIPYFFMLIKDEKVRKYCITFFGIIAILIFVLGGHGAGCIPYNINPFWRCT